MTYGCSGDALVLLRELEGGGAEDEWYILVGRVGRKNGQRQKKPRCGARGDGEKTKTEDQEMGSRVFSKKGNMGAGRKINDQEKVELSGPRDPNKG